MFSSNAHVKYGPKYSAALAGFCPPIFSCLHSPYLPGAETILGIFGGSQIAIGGVFSAFSVRKEVPSVHGSRGQEMPNLFLGVCLKSCISNVLRMLAGRQKVRELFRCKTWCPDISRPLDFVSPRYVLRHWHQCALNKLRSVGGLFRGLIRRVLHLPCWNCRGRIR